DVARPVSLAIQRSTVPPGRPTSFVVCATTRIDRTEFGLTPHKGRAGAIVARAAVVALVIWGLARVLGVELTVGKGDQASLVGAADVLVAVLLAGLAAWLVQRLLARRGAAGWWPFLGSTALSISIIGPTWLADGAASVVFIGMHPAFGPGAVAGFHGM